MSFTQIEKGHFGEVPLDGLRWGILAAWPAAIHLGNGKLQTIIEERANPRQRKAIETITHGGETEPGSLIWQVFATTITEFLPGVIQGGGESIRNPVTGAPHQVRVIMPTGFEFTESEVVSGKSKAGGPIELELDGSHAHIARIHWSTRGVVR